MAKDRSTSTRSAQDASKQSDAVQMLTADHRLVKDLFERYHLASAGEKTYITDRLIHELTIHAALEEELFYPAVESMIEPADALDSSVEGTDLDILETDIEESQGFEVKEIDGVELQLDDENGDEEFITQAYEDHYRVEELMEQLQMVDPHSSDHEEVFREFEIAVLEHISEEEDILFPVAASQLDIHKLGAAMQLRRTHLLSSSTN